MSNTYTWNVVDCEHIIATGMITDLYYIINAEDPDSTYTSSIYRSMRLDPADLDTMIPYDSVTEADTITWLQDSLGEERIATTYQTLDNRLVEMKTPTTGSGKPWSIKTNEEESDGGSV